MIQVFDVDLPQAPQVDADRRLGGLVHPYAHDRRPVSLASSFD